MVRGFTLNIILGTAVALILAVIAPPVVGLALGARPSAGGIGASQSVDRTHKGDRLRLPTVNGREKSPTGDQKMLTGCEPVFSSLSSSAASANFAGRCIA